MKSNKISIRKDADLKLLFDNFKNDLKDIRWLNGTKNMLKKL
jgi:hypothetical protein